MGVRPRIFINGISGLLGFHLAWHLRHKFLISGTCFRHQVFIPDCQIFPITLKSVDVLEALVRVQRPDFIIGAVGMSDRKEVEEQPKVSDMINITMPVSMAVLAGRLKAKYIALGCSEVFDGDKGNYAEDSTDFTLTDAVGKQKIAAHSYIRTQTMESTMLRIGRVLGVGHQYRPSFFDRIRTSASAKTPYEASKRKSRSYISTHSLAAAVEQLLQGEFPSKHRTFHVGGANMDEFSLVQAWYKLMGNDPKLVTELQDSKRDLSLNCKLMETNFPLWKPENKQTLLNNLITDLTPALGPKRWQKALQEL
ncbi:MAG: sugar nucleotide-binding protein [Bdellovibrionota bacterium]